MFRDGVKVADFEKRVLMAQEYLLRAARGDHATRGCTSRIGDTVDVRNGSFPKREAGRSFEWAWHSLARMGLHTSYLPVGNDLATMPEELPDRRHHAATRGERS